MTYEGARKGGGAEPETLRGKSYPLGPNSPDPPPGRPRGTRGGAGLRLGAPQSAGAPGLIRALPGGATPWPGKAPRPGTRFLPGAGLVGRKPSAVKFKEVRETLRRNLSSAGK